MFRLKIIHALLYSLIIVAVTACELTEEEKQALDESLILNPPEFIPPEPPVSGNLCTTDTFYQPDAEIVRKIDILFVTDTSGSLDVERPAIVDGIDSFTNQLPSEVDYQVGIMLGHGSKSNWHGRLFKRGKEPTVLSSANMSIADIRAHLRYKMQGTPGDNYSDGGEEELYSLSRAFDADRLQEMRTNGFLREDAALAVVFIADENDICAIYPSGVTPVPDPDNSELPAKARDCAGITHQSVYEKVKAYQNGRPFLFSGIVYNRLSQFEPGGENEIAYGLIELIEMSNGVAVDLAGQRYHEGLAEIGKLATKRLRLITDFSLSKTNVDPATIRVFVDRNVVPFSYNAQANQVHLTDYAGVEHSEVLVNYCPRGTDGDEDPVGDGGDDDDEPPVIPDDDPRF